MKNWKTYLSLPGRNLLALGIWVAFACLAGAACGLVGGGFHYAIDFAAELRAEHPWILWLLPALGAVIVLLYRLAGMADAPGTNGVLTAAGAGGSIPLRTAPLIFTATVLTHLGGGSSGREGAALQLGGALSSALGKRLRLDALDSRAVVMCGMAAAFSALFGTPLAAAVFAMEVAQVGSLYYTALMPCVLSSLVGAETARLLGVAPTAYRMSGIPELLPLSLLQTAALGVLVALLAVLFCKTMHLSHHLYRRFLPDPILRAVVGGGLVIGMTYLVWLWDPGAYDYNGAGSALIQSAIDGNARPEAFALKMLFTALTLGAGFQGGEIVPAFFTGAVFGCVTAPLLGLPAGFGAGLGMVSLFCGVTNCPMTSLLLALELFGGSAMPYFALAAAIAYMLSGNFSLYRAQQILHPKTTGAAKK